MRATKLIAALVAVLLLAWGGAAVLDDGTLPRESGASLPGDKLSRGADEPRDDAPESADLAAVSMPDARTPVPVLTEPVEDEDPCASIAAELSTERALRTKAEATIEELRAELASTTRELKACQFPLDTPYGAFLASYEAEEIIMASYEDEEITTRHVLAGIESWLDRFPVFLRPGEATWIAERNRHGDWGDYGRGPGQAMIRFLGPDRLMAELPPERAAELRDYYADEPEPLFR